MADSFQSAERCVEALPLPGALASLPPSWWFACFFPDTTLLGCLGRPPYLQRSAGTARLPSRGTGKFQPVMEVPEGLTPRSCSPLAWAEGHGPLGGRAGALQLTRGCCLRWSVYPSRAEYVIALSSRAFHARREMPAPSSMHGVN